MADIREYQQSDFDSVKNLIAQLQAHEREFYPDHVEPTSEWVGQYLSALFKHVETEKGTALVATSAGKVCGFVAAYVEFEPETQMNLFYISDLVVDKGHRGQGIGATLIQRIEDIARKEGYKRLLIGVLAQNEGAHQLYKKLGFREYVIQLTKDL